MKKTILRVAAAAAALAAGWFLRGMFGGMGGGPPPGMMMQMPPPTVAVRTVEEVLLRPADEYVARVEPVEEVWIRTEVPGYIAAVHFTEGGDVREGDLLFTIDPSHYRAAVAARAADLAQAEAEQVRAGKYLRRMKETDARSVSQAALETAESDLLRAEAGVQQAKANLERAGIELAYTEIRAPVDGRIGAALATKGNHVTSSSGDLARLVRTDPVRIVFSMPDREHLAMRRRELAGAAGRLAVEVRMADGTPYGSPGAKDFDDNAINPRTGTLAVRYRFPNPDGLLVPGAHVTARLYDREGARGIKIPQKALLTDQQGAYVLTVDEAGTAAATRIAAGRQVGTDVVVLSGLAPGDRVVVDGIQKARPGAAVTVAPAEAQP